MASVIYKWIVNCKVNCKVNSGFWGIVSIFSGLQINIWDAYYCKFTLILIVHDHALWKWILAARAWLTLPCAARAPSLAEQDSISFHADPQGIFSSAQRVRRGARLADRISFHGACQYDDKWNLKSEIIHFHSEFHFCLALVDGGMGVRYDPEFTLQFTLILISPESTK